jgi:hypothetical protein
MKCWQGFLTKPVLHAKQVAQHLRVEALAIHEESLMVLRTARSMAIPAPQPVSFTALRLPSLNGTQGWKDCRNAEKATVSEMMESVEITLETEPTRLAKTSIPLSSP